MLLLLFTFLGFHLLTANRFRNKTMPDEEFNDDMPLTADDLYPEEDDDVSSDTGEDNEDESDDMDEAFSNDEDDDDEMMFSDDED